MYFGIFQWLGWFYLLIPNFNIIQTNLFWLLELKITEEIVGALPGLLIFVLGTAWAVSFLYGFLYFVVLIYYILKLPFSKKEDKE